MSRAYKSPPPARVAEVSPHLSRMELVANEVGDRYAK
jgi:hypothetical protein